MSKERNLSREVVAVQIPSGDKVILPSGAKIFITQTLGGSFTVMTDTGLARVLRDKRKSYARDCEALQLLD